MQLQFNSSEHQEDSQDYYKLQLYKVQGLAVWRGAQARCDFAEALRCVLNLIQMNEIL